MEAAEQGAVVMQVDIINSSIRTCHAKSRLAASGGCSNQELFQVTVLSFEPPRVTGDLTPCPEVRGWAIATGLLLVCCCQVMSSSSFHGDALLGLHSWTFLRVI
jgi:hypothetical protein